jgi:hypothetical protein
MAAHYTGKQFSPRHVDILRELCFDIPLVRSDSLLARAQERMARLIVGGSVLTKSINHSPDQSYSSYPYAPVSLCVEHHSSLARPFSFFLINAFASLCQSQAHSHGVSD